MSYSLSVSVVTVKSISCLFKQYQLLISIQSNLSCILIMHGQGVYGYPIEIQALFFMALRCALGMLKHDEEGKEFVEKIVKRLHALSYHMRSYFWLDFQQLNDIYRYKTEEYSHTAVNKFNVIPDSIPDWVFDFMPMRGGYFIGNVSPARMDFRWFALGNCVAILASLATPDQASAIMDLLEERWEELFGEMPLKISYPAIESHEWRIVTGCDPKNTRWSYHNGGSWPGSSITPFGLLSFVLIKVVSCKFSGRLVQNISTGIVMGMKTG